MTKKSRRIMFYAGIIVFLLLSFVIVLIAFGYGYDFAHNKIVKTGALGMRLNTGASVYINDKLEGNTSFLNDSFNRNRLVPGQYAVRVYKPDYRTWEKNITISAGLYVDFPSINIIPNDLETEEIASQSSSGPNLLYDNWLIYFNKNGLLSYQDIRSVNEPAKVLDGSLSVAIGKKFKVISFDESKKIFLISSGTSSYILDPSTDTLRLMTKIPFSLSGNIYFRNNILYGLSGNQIMAFDTTNNTSKILINSAKMFSGNENYLAYINTTDRNLYILSLSNNQSTGPFILTAGLSGLGQFIRYSDSGYVILSGAESPALYKLDGNSVTKIANYIDRAELSPNQDRLLYFNSNEVSILYLSATNRQPYIAAGEKELITRTSKLISQPTWYGDEEHILLTIDGMLELLEIDSRGNRNNYDLTDSITTFGYDKNSDTVYDLSGSTISSILLH